jgi:DMSO/TMAO reductase YedYZ heme-binding membrane subunit
VVVNYMREVQLAQGVPPEQVYSQTMRILAGMLLLGLLSTLWVRPVKQQWLMTDAELIEEKRLAHERTAVSGEGSDRDPDGQQPRRTAMLVLAWVAVSFPLAWGVYRTLQTVTRFFP